MKRNVQLQALVAVLAAGFMFSSCGNIDIIKRKYRPGFHVDISKKQQKSTPVDQPVQHDDRTADVMQPLPTQKGAVEVADEPLVLTADAAAPVAPTYTAQVRSSMKQTVHTEAFKEMNFEDRMRTIRREVLKPNPAVANLEWMKWVSFGTGIGSLAFGAMALLFAFLTAVFFTGFVWGAAVLAILLGAAAITFSLIYKRNNGTGPQSRLGFIFGIIGAGLGVLAIIVGAIFFAVFVL